MSTKYPRFTGYLLGGTAFMLLLGRAYQHWFFEAPYRAFFLDEDWFGWAISWFGGSLSWSDYVLSTDTDLVIREYGYAVAVWFTATAILITLVNTSMRRLLELSLAVSTLLLLFMAVAYYLDAGYQIAQGMEYLAQVMTPLLLLLFLRQIGQGTLLFLVRIAVAVTFVGHGLYALGVYPVPGTFVYMIMVTLGFDEGQARLLLQVAGILDLLVGVGVFIPKMDRWAFLYAVLWGFLTAAARLTSHIHFNHLVWTTLHQTVFEFVIRIPHFMVPFIGWQLSRLSIKGHAAKEASVELMNPA